MTTAGADVLVSDVGIPAIALTAYARPSDRARALDAGFEMYFAKPVELAALQAGLAKLTGRDAGHYAT